MSGTRGQAILFFLLSLALSIFLTGHSVLVEIDAKACLENLADSVNGHRSHATVSEMSFGRLAQAVAATIASHHLILGILGFLPLLPFLVAWRASKDRRSRLVWTAAAGLAFVSIAAWISTTSLAAYYDCDLGGVSLGILFAPILYMAINIVAALALAGLRFFTRHLVEGRGD